jgi:hypothetical protein
VNLDNFWLANALSLSLVFLFLLQSAVLGVLYLQFMRQRFWGGAVEGGLSPMEILLSTLCGSMITGVLFFSLGHLRMGLQLTAWFWVACTLGLCLWQRFLLARVMAATARSLAESWSTLTNGERWSFAAVLSVAIVRSLSTAAPQTHGDQYLYHLTVGRIWDAMNYPGIDVLNVATGYSWSIESIYAYIYQFTGTGFVHILAAQQLHCFFGFFGLLLVTYKIIRLGFGRVGSILLLLLFMSPYLTQMTFFAKNDAIAFLMVWLVLWAVLVSFFGGKPVHSQNLDAQSEQPVHPVLIVLLISPFLLAAKITAAIGCAVIGGCAILGRALFRDRSVPTVSDDARVLGSFTFWLGLATLSVVGILPYLIAAGIQTGNPLFPILNNIFQSPLMPLTAKAIVQEMSPFAAGPMELLRGSWIFAKDHPVCSLIPLALLASWGVRSSAFRAGCFLVAVGFVALLSFQILLNTYGSSIEQRHFKLASYSFIVATVLLCSQIPSRRLRMTSAGLLVVMGIIHLQVEVNVRDVVRRIAAPDLKEYFFSQKPINRLFQVANVHTRYCVQCAVYTVGNLLNEGYFLTPSRLVHDSISAPIVSSGDEDELIRGLEQIHRSWPITYAVVASNQADRPGSKWIRQRMSLVMSTGELSLYRMNE